MHPTNFKITGLLFFKVTRVTHFQKFSETRFKEFSKQDFRNVISRIGFLKHIKYIIEQVFQNKIPKIFRISFLNYI